MVFRDHFFGCFCGGTLEARKARDYTVRACRQCGGAWVTHGDLVKMLQIMEHPGEKAVPPLKYDGVASKRSCPACKKTMKIVYVAGETLDECGEHGVWFDERELESVLYKFMTDDSDS